MIKKIFLFLYLFAPFRITAQPVDKCVQILEVLNKVKDACQRFPPQDYCNVFVGQAINDIYNVSDFKSSASITGYFDANTIIDLLFTTLSDKWQNIGSCDNQTSLTTAQNNANSNRCVIAIWKNPDINRPGHISLILPGELKSGWNGMMVPNSANFAMNAPQLNFVCQKLSGAFGIDKRSGVFLFVRKDL